MEAQPRRGFATVARGFSRGRGRTREARAIATFNQQTLNLKS